MNSLNEYLEIPDYGNLTLDENGDYCLRIRDMPLSNRPREKLLMFGAPNLSMAELIAIVLKAGDKKEGVMELANRIIREYGEKSILYEKDPKIIAEMLNISLIKAMQIVACGEIGRRLFENNTGEIIIRNVEQAFKYLSSMRFLAKEELRGLYLNSRFRLIHDEIISIGTVNSNMVHIRDIFRPAIRIGAVAIILAHNHPTGDSAPSDNDVKVTNRIVGASKIMGISVIDHIVIGASDYQSIINRENKKDEKL